MFWLQTHNKTYASCVARTKAFTCWRPEKCEHTLKQLCKSFKVAWRLDDWKSINTSGCSVILDREAKLLTRPLSEKRHSCVVWGGAAEFVPDRNLKEELTKNNWNYPRWIIHLFLTAVKSAALSRMLPGNLLYNQRDCESQRVVVKQSVVL